MRHSESRRHARFCCFRLIRRNATDDHQHDEEHVAILPYGSTGSKLINVCSVAVA